MKRFGARRTPALCLQTAKHSNKRFQPSKLMESKQVLS